MDLLKAIKQAQAAINLSRVMLGQPPITPLGVDTTGFAKKSNNLLLDNAHQTPVGFVGNRRGKDMSQYSPALLRSISSGVGDGSPVPWYNKPTDQGFVMQPLGDPNVKINLGMDKAFADYVSTIGVTEANKLKNPLAYLQAQREFAKRVNIKPIDSFAQNKK